ncbi:hypothetical protein NHP194004_11630 [Helicobacter suis]|nr:hypothetical protein NHP194004_11630 [Helicobacter suis]
MLTLTLYYFTQSSYIALNNTIIKAICMTNFRAVLQRLKSTPVVINKGSKSEAGTLGEFKVYDEQGQEVLSL